MVETYLALMKDQASNIKDEDRFLILNALFRRYQSDGTDDAPPPNMIEILKNLGER